MTGPTIVRHRPEPSRRDLCWLVALLIVAAALRLPGLDQVPPGFQFDEAYNALDALRVIDGERPIFLPANAGREALYTYWQAPFVAVLGPTAVAGRLASAIPGIATVLLLYLFVRTVFPDRPRSLAGMAGLALAISYWHMHYSRYGIRSITVPFWILQALLFLWLGLRDGRMRWFALSGVPLAALVWTHPVGRIVPAIVVATVLAEALLNRPNARRALLGLALSGLVAVVLFAPLGYYFLHHQHHFFNHASDVSVFATSDTPREMVQVLAENALRVALMFNVRGDAEWIHNWPGRPVFDPLGGAAFILGLVLAAWRVICGDDRREDRLPYLMLFAWAGVILLASAFSDMAPNTSRTLGAAPAIIVFFALGTSWVLERLANAGRARLGVALAVIVLSWGGGSTAYDYFVRFGQDPRTPNHYDADKIQAAEFLIDASHRSTVYLSRLWARHATVQLLTRDMDQRIVETDAAIVLPAQEAKSVLYAFPPEQANRADKLATLLGDWAHQSVTVDDQGDDLLHLVEIDAQHRPEIDQGAAFVRDETFFMGPVQGNIVAFEQGLTLLGYIIEPTPLHENTLCVDLLWQAAQPIAGDYGLFLHLIDDHGDLIAQRDGPPGDGSYRTNRWHGGDLVIERRRLTLPDCTPAGEFELRTGWYELASGQNLLTEAGMSSARVGHVALDGVTLLDADGSTTSDSPGQEIIPGAWLLAVSSPDTAEVGRHVIVAVRLALDARWSGAQASLAMLGEGGAAELAQWTLPEFKTPVSICLACRSRADDLPPGAYSLSLSVPGPADDVAIGEMTLVASSRLYDAPAMDEPVDVSLGGIRLLGANLAQPAEPVGQVKIELVWQLAQPAPTSYTVFVHLLDENNRLVAQSDSVPMAGAYPTNLWAQDEIVIDAHTLALPADLPPGRYHPRVGLYDGATGARLSTTADAPGGLRNALDLGLTVQIE